MTMELEQRSEPVGDRRRRWVAGLAAAMLVAASGGVGFGLGYALGGEERITESPAASGEPDEDESDAVADGGEDASVGAVTSAPAGEAPEPAPTDVGAEPATTDPDPGVASVDFEESGSEYWPGPDGWQPMELVYSRTTAGLTVRVQRGVRWPHEPGDFGDPSGWQQPGWCQPSAPLRVTLAGEGVVDVGFSPWYDELFEGRWATMLAMGHADAAPHRIVVVQTGGDVGAVTARFADGGADSTEPVDGVAVLLVPGGPPAVAELSESVADPLMERFEIVLSTAAGEETVSRDQFGWDNPAYRASCQPPPPALPAPGEQPADPAAAEGEIRAVMSELYGGDGELEGRQDLVDDPTGVAEARQQVREGGFEAEAASAVAIIEELVFTTPEEAWFRYRIETMAVDLDGRYGRAVLIDGAWHITRDTVCQDLSLAGGDCGGWRPVVLPSG